MRLSASVSTGYVADLQRSSSVVRACLASCAVCQQRPQGNVHEALHVAFANLQSGQTTQCRSVQEAQVSLSCHRGHLRLGVDSIVDLVGKSSGVNAARQSYAVSV